MHALQNRPLAHLGMHCAQPQLNQKSSVRKLASGATIVHCCEGSASRNKHGQQISRWQARCYDEAALDQVRLVVAALDHINQLPWHMRRQKVVEQALIPRSSVKLEESHVLRCCFTDGLKYSLSSSKKGMVEHTIVQVAG